MRKPFAVLSLAALAAIAVLSLLHPAWLWLLVPVLPLALWGWYDMLFAADNVTRIYPVVGRLKQVLARERQLPQETVLENATQGRPFDWVHRRVVEARTRDEADTVAFGSQVHQLDVGFEAMIHSAYPVDRMEGDLRVWIGGPRCRRPYSASILNVSGMSYGSIGLRAVRSLNAAAKLGDFAHNTGEGGVSDYHLAEGGDLIFQFGTAYFGCRDDDGDFSPDAFTETVSHEAIKMVEVKISQGAKPGMGGILPAEKNTEEIARFRGVEPHQEIRSPAAHTAFTNARELVEFVDRVRELADGRPVGVKLCVGRYDEIEDLAAVMAETGGGPDFLTVDSADGGSGAGAVDFIHWVGRLGRDAVPRVDAILRRHGVRDRVKLLASGRVISSFDLVRYLALGADACYSARGMLFALGCVQALRCQTNRCPSGITTLDPSRNRGIVVEIRKHRIANFHRHTLEGVKELVAAAGLGSLDELGPEHIYRRVSPSEIVSLAEVAARA